MRKTAAYIAIVLAASLPVRGGEFHTVQTFYQDVTLAAWAPTGAISSITATNGGSLATGTWYYAVSATNVGGQHSSLSGETNIVVSGTNDLSVVLQWPVVSGGRGYIVWRGSATGNLTNYYEVGYDTNWTDVGTNTWSNGTHTANSTPGELSGWSPAGMVTNPAVASTNGSFAFGINAGQNSAGEANIFFGISAGDGQTGDGNVHVGYDAGAGSSGSTMYTFGTSAGEGASADFFVAVGEAAGQYASGQGQGAYGGSALAHASGLYQFGYGFGAGFFATGDHMHAYGLYAGYGNKDADVLYLDIFDFSSPPTTNSWTNNFLTLHAAQEYNETQTGYVGRSSGEYNLRGSWNKSDGIIGMGGSNAIWRSREVVVQILTNAGFASTNLTLTNILYLGEQP